MVDGVQAPTINPTPASAWVSNHPKVSASLFAGALTNLVLALLKTKFNLDLSGQEDNLTLVIMSAVGYLVPNSN